MQRLRVLVTGAHGFIGSHILAALIDAGHEVVCAVRKQRARADRHFSALPVVVCDMARDVDTATWLPRLAGIDALVNCAGILRERPGESFENVHVAVPRALFMACAAAGVRRVVHISALGNAADGEFIASKHRGDTVLTALPLDAIVLRPSLVYSLRGSYGGTSLLRAMAALPGMLLLPGDGAQLLQPIAAEDLGTCVVAALTQPMSGSEVIELCGPAVMTLAQYLRQWRAWLGLRPAREIHVPRTLVRMVSVVAERFGHGPLGETMRRMLDRGNVASPDAFAQIQARLGVQPHALSERLLATPAQTQDRQHARLYFWLPTLRTAMALLWIASGLTGLLLPTAALQAATQGGLFSPASAVVLGRAAGVIDSVLGIACLTGWRPRWVLAAMLVMLAAYTLGVGILWPRHWLDPLGGLIKNIPLFATLVLLLAAQERR
ncbi:MAG: NAD-dependent epimerase/dehydratase family protein [Rhodanobacter sp.]|jgi:uncharacterized protein YbjT (DUF2867 family)/uncharacterized membrane protein YphA (DoxX/SURF4 family)|nr:NAD-dependent epimerase/dehydratase family protein [Rhodanobacter sp.]